MNRELFEVISRMFNADKFPHAVLLYGDKGIGKKYAANMIASALLCKNPHGLNACGECESCILLKSDSHPDKIEAEHSGKRMGISVATVRFLCADASVVPNTSDNKVYLLFDADSMEQAAQNALLKIIEEPPENVYFILTSQSRSAFLPTVLSRVVSLGVGECTEEECLNALAAHGVPYKDAQDAYEACGGNIGKCLGLLNDEKQSNILKLVKSLTDCIISRNEYEFLKICHCFENDTETSKSVLLSLSEVFRDVSALRAEGTRSISLYKRGAKELSKTFSFQRADDLYNYTKKAYLDIKSNVSPKLALCTLSGVIFE